MGDKHILLAMRRREFLRLAGFGIAALAAPALSGSADAQSKGGIRMAHELPPLPYAYDALEPHLNAETLHLHHDKHHAAYVNNWNAAEEKLQSALKSGDFANARCLSDDLAFNGSGAILHTIYWHNMKPGGGGEPSGDLADMINKYFVSFDAFKGLFLATANQVQGSGWGVLAYRPTDGGLAVLGAEKHQNVTQWGAVPLLVLDVWEHAYYLQYQNKRPDYTKAFMDSLVNWDDVAKRLQAAKSGSREMAGVSG